MKYCCTEFERKSKYFDRQIDGTWTIRGCSQCYVLTRVKFCPYCGSDLAPRLVAQKSVVYDNKVKRVIVNASDTGIKTYNRGPSPFPSADNSKKL